MKSGRHKLTVRDNQFTRPDQEQITTVRRPSDAAKPDVRK
jgi:hypothetical protein